MPRLTIEVQEIMILVNYAWEESFARAETNKTAIAERGWFPLNRCLLLDKQLRSTMTVKEHEEEAIKGILLPFIASDSYAVIDDTAPTLGIQYLLPPPPLLKNQIYRMVWQLGVLMLLLPIKT